jgi:hypothetical protein
MAPPRTVLTIPEGRLRLDDYASEKIAAAMSVPEV